MSHLYFTPMGNSASGHGSYVVGEHIMVGTVASIHF
jgi:hypothetical protein